MYSIEDEIMTVLVDGGQPRAAAAKPQEDAHTDEPHTMLYENVEGGYVEPAKPAKPYRATLVREKTGQRLELTPLCVVGRGSAADVRVTGNTAVSRLHMRVELRDGRCLVTDLDSTNGTYVDGKRLLPLMPTETPDGATIALSRDRFKLIIEEA